MSKVNRGISAHVAVTCAIAVLLFGYVAAKPAAAQVLYGSIVGAVEDQSGAVVPKATVTITNKATGQTREAASDDGGRFSLLNVTAGLYDLKVSAQGFRTTTKTDIEVTINTVTRVDMRARSRRGDRAGDGSGDRHCAADRQVRRAARNHGTDAPESAAARLSQLSEPDCDLVPGASPPALQNAVVDTPGRALRSFVNGTATNNNNTLVDGAVNINIWLPHHVAYVQPVESIETVNISTGSFDAEQGMAGGAAVTLATKSGTNNLHGTGWWFHNNQHFNSDPIYFRAATYKKPLTILNIFGGNIGGPIKKDKLFYFFNFERTTERTGYFGNYSTAPADFRAGDFSKWTQYSRRLRSGDRSPNQRRRAHSVREQHRPAGALESHLPEHLQGCSAAQSDLADRPAEP